jgi:cytoskeletal protein CcmA (bactofilin family)
MFGKKKPSKLLQLQKVPFKSVLDRGCTIHGKLEFSGNYHVLGRVLGDVLDIASESAVLWIDKSAHIKGNIQCSNLVLLGKLEGNIVASGVVEVCSGATIIGDIQSERLHVDSNARINGRLSCLNGENLEAVLQGMSPGLESGSAS